MLCQLNGKNVAHRTGFKRRATCGFQCLKSEHDGMGNSSREAISQRGKLKASGASAMMIAQPTNATVVATFNLAITISPVVIGRVAMKELIPCRGDQKSNLAMLVPTV